MTFTDSILLNLIYVISPLILYLFFASYNKSLDKEENSLILELSLFTSLYFSIRLESNYTILIINIPLIISYLKKNDLSIISLSVFIIFYLFNEYNLNIYLLLLEYLIYYGIYYLLDKKNVISIYIVMLNILIFTANFIFILSLDKIVLTIFLFIIVTIITLIILDKANKVMKYHMTIKELEQEKQIRMSLFKITHEIKNPLAVCKGYLDMFDVNNIEHAIKYIPILKEEIDKTLIILKDFLSFTKIKIEEEILDVNYLLEEIIDNLEPLLKEKNIILSNKILDDDIYINGDYSRLSQVFINVLKNSIEALETRNKPKITVSTHLKDKIVEIIIADNGVGINENDLVNIAKPFFTTKKDGTGLGVSMSFEIIKAHGGTMKYSSIKNKGTSVIIELPIKKEL